jgi:hypothetical protein
MKAEEETWGRRLPNNPGKLVASWRGQNLYHPGVAISLYPCLPACLREESLLVFREQRYALD